MKYAANTSVSTDASQAEIKRTVQRYGARSYATMEDNERAIIVFEMNGRRIMFRLPLPSRSEREFTHHSRGARTDDAAFKAWEQACRQRWRALALAIKAKMESVEAGIETFDEAFLAHVVMPDGQTVGEAVAKPLALAYSSGSMQPLLPARRQP